MTALGSVAERLACALAFAFSGSVRCMRAGLVTGSVIGVIIGLVWGQLDDTLGFSGRVVMLFVSSIGGFGFGIAGGALLSVPVGFIAFLCKAIGSPHSDLSEAVLVETYQSAAIIGYICALGGAATGLCVALYFARHAVVQLDVDTDGWISNIPAVQGLSYGGIGGYCFGLFLGALGSGVTQPLRRSVNEWLSAVRRT